MLHLLEVRECLVEVPEDGLQNFGRVRLRARNTILEQARHAVAGREERMLLPQPDEHLALDLLHGDVTQAGAAGAAGGVLLRDQGPPAEELCRFDGKMK